MIELRGAPVAERIRNSVAESVARLPHPPKLASILDPDAPDAVSYSSQLRKACERLGIGFVEQTIGEDSEQLIQRLNDDPGIASILLHDPAPEGLRDEIQSRKDPEHPIPCTALAVMEVLAFYEIPLDGAEVVVVGRSKTVGRPVVQLLLDRRPGPTVTVCHTGTRDIAGHTARAEVVIAAAGVPKLIDTVAEGAVVIDVGTNVVEGQLVGDVDPAIASRCSALTPVPGGVGPVTVACLLRNVVAAAQPTSSGAIRVRDPAADSLSR